MPTVEVLLQLKLSARSYIYSHINHICFFHFIYIYIGPIIIIIILILLPILLL